MCELEDFLFMVSPWNQRLMYYKSLLCIMYIYSKTNEILYLALQRSSSRIVRIWSVWHLGP